MKAVIIRFSSLGDVVLTSATVEALNHAGAEIAFVTKPQYTPLFTEDPRIKRIIPLSTIGRVLSEIKDFKPDFIIDLHGTMRSLLVSFLSSGKTIRTKKHSLSRRILVKYGIGKKQPRSVVEDHLKAISKLGISMENIYPKLYPSQKGLSEAKKRLANIPKNELVIIHPYARYPLKAWDREKFQILAENFTKAGFNVIFISDGINKPPVYYANNLTLEGLVGIISMGDIFIGNDSGPSHIAAALELATVTIFGPSHPALGFKPNGKHATFVASQVGCSPCTLHGKSKCKYKTRLCFDSITPDIVFEKAMFMYKQKRTHNEKKSHIYRQRRNNNV